MRWISWLAVLAGLAMASPDLPASEPVSDAKLLTGRLRSCDAEVARTAAREVLGSLERQDPSVLFVAANALQGLGQREDAAFLSVASLLRLQRQRLFTKGDASQALGIYSGYLSGMMMPYVEAEPEFADTVVRRVLTWDRATPDANRNRAEARTAENAAKLREMELLLAELPKNLRKDPARVATARRRMATTDQMIADRRARDCAPGRLDPKDIPVVESRIKPEAEKFVAAHPMVLAHSPGKPLQARVATVQIGSGSGLPKRLTITVRPEQAGVRPQPGETFYAEVDVRVRVSPRRTLESIDFALVCLTGLWVGQRDSSWKDVCISDPAAQRP